MKKLLTLIIAAVASLTLSAQTVAVLDFETDSFCIEDTTGTMSDLLTDELVNISHITVLERKYISKIKEEMKFQSSSYADPATAKSIGKMIGADCVIIGTANMLGCTLNVTARTVEVETGKILYSTDVESFKDAYRLVSGETEQLPAFRDRLIGCRAHAFGFTGLMRREDAETAEGLRIAPADMESIMIYTEKEDGHESAAL